MKYSKKDIDYEHTLEIVSPIVSEYLTFVEISVLKRCSTILNTNVYLPRVLVSRMVGGGLKFEFVDYSIMCTCRLKKEERHMHIGCFLLLGYPRTYFLFKLEKAFIKDKKRNLIKHNEKFCIRSNSNQKQIQIKNKFNLKLNL